MEKVGRAFKRIVKIQFMFVRCRRLGKRGATDSRLESSLALKQLVAQTIQVDRLSLQSAIELQEKLYVNFRIFVEHLQQFAPTMNCVILIINLYNYGFIALGIWQMRTMKNYIHAPVAMLIMDWFSALFLIGLASNIHAKAKQLHLHIWNLLEVTCNCTDVRQRHLHSLWLKQVQALDMDGGLALKAFNVRITYVRIIKLVIASGTFIVLAFRA